MLNTLSDDDLRAGAAGGQQLRQRFDVAMRVDRDARFREPGAVDQGGVVQRLGKDHRIGIHTQGTQDREVGHVAGAQRQRARLFEMRRHPLGQALLKKMMCAAVARHQVRGAAAGAIQLGAFAQRFDDLRMRGQAQVIVAAKGQQVTAVDQLARRAGAIGDAAAARQAARGQRVQLAVDGGDQIHHITPR
jgi:hypothetical protein